VNDDTRMIRQLRVPLAGLAVACGSVVVTGQDGDPQGNSKLTVREDDGSPSMRTRTLVVPNGSLTDSGSGTATLDVVGAATISDVSDVDTTGAAEGAFLRYETATWVDSTAAISDLSDVAAITTQTDGQVLTYDATDGWRNEDAAGAESLAQTLVVGATTGGTSLTMTAGDAILGSANEVVFGSSASPVTSLSVVVATDGDTLDVSVSGEVVTVAAESLTASARVGDATVTGAADLVLGATADDVLVDAGDAIVLDSVGTTTFEVGATSEQLAVTGGTDTITVATTVGTNAALRIDSLGDAGRLILASTGYGEVEVENATLVLSGSSLISSPDADLRLYAAAGVNDVQVETTGGGVFRVVDTGGGELTVTPADAAESVAIATVGTSSDLTITPTGTLALTSTDAALALTANTGGVTITDSSETLTISTTGANAIAIDAGTGSALAVTAALGVTITPAAGDVDLVTTGGYGVEVYVDGGGFLSLIDSDGGQLDVYPNDAAAGVLLESDGDVEVNLSSGDLHLRAPLTQLALGANTTTTYSRHAAGLVTLSDNVSTQVAALVTADGTYVGGTIVYAIESTDGTEYQVHSGVVTFSIVDDAGGVVADIDEGTQSTAVSSSTLVDTWAITTTDDQDIEIMLTADSGLVPTTLRVRMEITLTSAQALSIP